MIAIKHKKYKCNTVWFSKSITKIINMLHNKNIVNPILNFCSKFRNTKIDNTTVADYEVSLWVTVFCNILIFYLKMYLKLEINTYFKTSYKLLSIFFSKAYFRYNWYFRKYEIKKLQFNATRPILVIIWFDDYNLSIRNQISISCFYCYF